MDQIKTERLLLRPAHKDDLDALHAIMCDGEAMQYWSTLPHTDTAQTKEFLEATMHNPIERGEDFIVELDGQVIGKAGFWQFPEVGFLFDRRVWGQGYASEAVGAVLERGFRVHGMAKVIADVDPRNVASIRVLEKLGFVETHREEKTFLLGDEWSDSVYFACLPPQN
ncbi:MAG: GNAT family N-acetyltransferase [Shimia sp.]|jgi:RimJ/RimL family protein N-acetyltransferase|uniref:GNAT family N-acetyltransferase n=1 Tax=Shimia sp. TaxID=1954381 RepID=UPI004058887B